MHQYIRKVVFGRTCFVALSWFLLGLGTAWAQTISTSDGLSLTLDATGRITSLSVDSRQLVSAPEPLVAVRDVSAAGSVFAPNLVYNGGFEIDDGSGNADGWSVYLASKAGVSRVTGQQAEGAHSVFFETDPATDADGIIVYFSSAFPVTEGTRYRFSAQTLARDGYLALRQTAPEWQRSDYLDVLAGNIRVGGIYVAWFDQPAASGNPMETVLVAPMHTNASVWKRITGEGVAPSGAVSARVVIAARLLDGKQEDDGLWVDDVTAIVSPESDVPVAAAVTQVGNDLVLAGSVAGAGLGLEVMLHPLSDRIEVSGTVSDATASARALEVAVRLPLDLGGFLWWDDIRTSRPIAAGASYANTISALATGNLPQSLYPLAAVDDGQGALAAAVPLDEPRVASFAVDELGRFEIRFRVGISPQATRLGNTATFNAYLYRTEPGSGFRGALEKLRSFHPEWFDSPRPVYDFAGGAQGNFRSEGACVPGCEGSCEQCCTGASMIACYDAQNVATGQYTAPEGPTKVGPAALPPPSYWDFLTQLANPPSGEEERYPALATSLIKDGNGDYVLKHVTNPNWSPNDWEANWVLDMDPDLGGGYAEWTRLGIVDPAFASAQATGGVLDGVQFDNFMSAPAIDLDPAHLAVADHTLAYDPNTYQPGIHTMASTYEYLSWLRAYLDATYGTAVALSANIWGIGTLNFLAPFLDAMGNETKGEGSKNFSRELITYRRTIAYHKPLSSPWQRADVTVAEAEDYAELMLVYGMATSQATHGTNWEEGAEAVLDAARETLDRFWYLGWEPVTHASTGDADVWVERFGSAFAAPRDSIYFTVHNSTDAYRAFTLSVDTGSLGLPVGAPVVVKDARSGATLGSWMFNDELTISDGAEGRRTRVIRLMAPGCNATELRLAKVSFRPKPASDAVRLKGSFVPPTTEPDFVASSVRFVLYDRDGDVYAPEVPAGGFTASSNGKRFRFKDRDGTVADGLRSAVFRRRGDGSYRWSAKAKGVALGAADRSYLDVLIEVGGDCWADSRNCTLSPNGRKLICRP